MSDDDLRALEDLYSAGFIQHQEYVQRKAALKASMPKPSPAPVVATAPAPKPASTASLAAPQGMMMPIFDKVFGFKL